MGLTDRFRAAFAYAPSQSQRDAWPFLNFNGNTYPLSLFNQSLQGTKEEIGTDFIGFGDGTLKANPVVFACMQARLALFSEARFMYRQLRSGAPGELFSNPDLEILRHPWPGATTGDLLSRVMQDSDLAGNAIWVKRPGRLVRLRPDWVTFIHGSLLDPDIDMWDVDADLLGIAYQPGGPAGGRKPVFFQPTEFAHFAPIPDPIAPARGMSWLTPLIREIQADSQMTTHKQSYLVNGATPNLVVMGVPGSTKDEYQGWVDKFAAGHQGAANAYRSMYLTPGMDAKVLGNDLAEVDFKAVQGLGETRIAAAAGVPAAVVGISEGLAGSSLNAGNFQASMRRFADLTMRGLWRNVCGSFEQIIRTPSDAELWYDDRDIPALKDDIKDYAEVQSLQAQAIRGFVDAGFEPASVVDAVNAGDLKRLKHTGLYSVQLQPPQPDGPADPAPTPTPPPPARDAALWRLVDVAERRAEAAEQRETPAPVITVNTPENPVTVTIERGAVEVSAPVTIEPAVVNVTTPEVRNEITVEPAAVTVEPTPLEITVEASPVEIRNEVNVEPTPIEVRNEVTLPEQPTPDVHVTVEPSPLEVRVEASPVTVQTPDTIRIESMPDRVTRRVVKRDESHEIVETSELETDG